MMTIILLQVTSELIIPDTYLEDEGNYRCLVYDEMRNILASSSYAELTVTGVYPSYSGASD